MWASPPTMPSQIMLPIEKNFLKANLLATDISAPWAHRLLPTKLPYRKPVRSWKLGSIITIRIFWQSKQEESNLNFLFMIFAIKKKISKAMLSSYQVIKIRALDLLGTPLIKITFFQAQTTKKYFSLTSATLRVKACLGKLVQVLKMSNGLILMSKYLRQPNRIKTFACKNRSIQLGYAFKRQIAKTSPQGSQGLGLLLRLQPKKSVFIVIRRVGQWCLPLGYQKSQP